MAVLMNAIMLFIFELLLYHVYFKVFDKLQKVLLDQVKIQRRNKGIKYVCFPENGRLCLFL